MTDTAAGMGVAGPTLSVAVQTLLRTRWVSQHRISDDRRVVGVRLTQRGTVLARRITDAFET
jgi:DNA-binding MarR family transcriptional regulator